MEEQCTQYIVSRFLDLVLHGLFEAKVQLSSVKKIVLICNANSQGPADSLYKKIQVDHKQTQSVAT